MSARQKRRSYTGRVGTRAGVTGFNMHHALPLAIVLFIGLYALAISFLIEAMSKNIMRTKMHRYAA
jgi:hypothetical protein